MTDTSIETSTPMPQWVASSLNVREGRDPLGLQTLTTDRLMPLLLPGIVDLSQRARYLSFFAFCLDEYRRRRLEPDGGVFQHRRGVSSAYDRRQSDTTLCIRSSSRPFLSHPPRNVSEMRKVDPAQLVGAAEIAQRLNLSVPQTVHDWRRRHADFPRPVAELTMGMVWHWPEVEEWARRTRRLP